MVWVAGGGGRRCECCTWWAFLWEPGSLWHEATSHGSRSGTTHHGCPRIRHHHRTYRSQYSRRPDTTLSTLPPHSLHHPPLVPCPPLPAAPQFCHAVGLTLIFTWVVAAPLAAAFARRDFPDQVPDEKHPSTAATAASAAGPGSASTSGSRELAGGGASGGLRRRREAPEELAAEGVGEGDPREVPGAVGPSRAAVAAGVAALVLTVGMAAWDLGTLMSTSWGKDGWHWLGAGGGL